MQMRIDEAGQDGVTMTVQQLGVARNERLEVGLRTERYDPVPDDGHGFGGRTLWVLAENRPSVRHEVGWGSGQRHGPCQQKGRCNGIALLIWNGS